jgi:hypothetical protein
MKPAWDELMAEYQNHSSILIADVDCTAEGKYLCDDVGVEGFPTIKYGDPNNLEDYDGERDIETLKDFAKKNLGPRCSAVNLDLCDADAKAQIDAFMAMPAEELDAKVREKDDTMKAIDTELEGYLKSLQAKYEQAETETREKKTAIKSSGLGLMKAAMAHRRSGTAEF